MVCIVDVSYEGQRFERTLFLSKSPSELTNEEIMRYFKTHDVPEYFASPLPQREGYIEIGKKTDKRYYGIRLLEEEMRENARSLDNEGVKFNTFYNEVLAQALERGMFSIEEEHEVELMGHKLGLTARSTFRDYLHSVRSNYLYKNSETHKQIMSQLDAIEAFEKWSKKQNHRRVRGRDICSVVA